MSKKIIVWGNFVGVSTCGIPIGHISWNFEKNYLSFPQVLQFVKEYFQNKFYQEPFVSFIELGHFGFFDASIIM